MNISFFHTQDQVRDQSKTHTRRLGWKNLKPGTILDACVKCQGLKKGEKVEKICQIRVVDVWWEQLKSITQEEVIKEGFPSMSRNEFIAFFCKNMKCTPETVVTVIEFEYL